MKINENLTLRGGDKGWTLGVVDAVTVPRVDHESIIHCVNDHGINQGRDNPERKRGDQGLVQV